MSWLIVCHLNCVINEPVTTIRHIIAISLDNLHLATDTHVEISVEAICQIPYLR